MLAELEMWKVYALKRFPEERVDSLLIQAWNIGTGTSAPQSTLEGRKAVGSGNVGPTTIQRAKNSEKLEKQMKGK